MGTKHVGKENEKTVASVGDKEISREDWLSELEAIHGKDILTSMINEESILQMANKHRLTVSDDEIKIESVLQQVLYGTIGNRASYKSEEEFKRKLEVSILLEKLLTKDVVITDDEVESYYKNNKSLLTFRDLYHLSHITVAGKNEANALIKELEAGADFSVRAIERSGDRYTADIGGDLGYLSLDSETIPAEYKEAASLLEVGYWSRPVKVMDDYAILYLRDHVRESELSFDKIKSILKRKVAIEQMNTPLSAEVLWEQFDVEWIYGK